MRVSTAGLALIQRAGLNGAVEYLTQWNRKWRMYSLVGGHVEEGESLRECCVREIIEELELLPEVDFRVDDNALSSHSDYTAMSGSAKVETTYRVGLFATELLTPTAIDTVNDNPINRWVTEFEILRGETSDRRPISAQVETVFKLCGVLQGEMEYDLFISYARADNREGWIERFVDALVEEHQRFTGGRPLKIFFDRHDIHHFSHWEAEIFNKGLAKSKMFVAFLSPRYFGSEVCRREWKAWIDQEISRHILSSGTAPVYIVKVPGFVSKSMLGEQKVARCVAKLCGIKPPHHRMVNDLSPIITEFRRRQLFAVRSLYKQGVAALQQADLRKELHRLAGDIEGQVEVARLGAASVNTVPPYNTKFVGRLQELVQLRHTLTDNPVGVIAGIHGLGGIGKTELAYTFAHAYAGVYPGGRFHVACERQTNLRDALQLLGSGQHFSPHITDEERKSPDAHFAAIVRCLGNRIRQYGNVLLVLDNVTDHQLVERQQTDCLTVLGSKLHLLATTRLPPRANTQWLMLGELKPDEGLALLEKFRPCANDDERVSAQSIVQQLGGFALAIELVAAAMAANKSMTYAGYAEGLGLDNLDMLAEQGNFELRRHNHERRLEAVLGPTLTELPAEDRRTLEYAAFLPPDSVPLPWLKTLILADYPDLATIGIFGDPWTGLCERLVLLGLFTRVEEETTSQRQVRVHRLVQDLLRRQMSEDEQSHIQKRIYELVTARDAELKQTTNWQTARWELEPLDALAWLWDETEHRRTSWLMNQMGQRWLHVADWPRAEPLMRRALAIDEHTFGTDHEDVARDLNNLAQLLQATNRMTEAELLMRRALVIYEHTFGTDHHRVATTLNNLALLLQATNRMNEAESLMRQALVTDEHNFGKDHRTVATDLNNLAQLLLATNRMGEAEPLMRRALAIDEHTFGTDHEDVARDLNNLAQLLQATNRMTEAELLMRRALVIYEHTFGTDHHRVATTLNNLALLLQATNRMNEAESLMRQALINYEKSFGKDHPRVATALNNLAQLLLATNRMGEAEPLMRRALDIDEHGLGPDHADVARDLNNLALLLQATDRMGEAEPLMRRALVIYEHSFGTDHPDVARALNNLAQLLQVNNRMGEAEPLMARVVRIFEKCYGENHPNVAVALNNVATLLHMTTQMGEAEPLFFRAAVILSRFQIHTGHQHPNLDASLGNHTQCLEELGRSQEQIDERLREIIAEAQRN